MVAALLTAACELLRRVMMMERQHREYRQKDCQHHSRDSISEAAANHLLHCALPQIIFPVIVYFTVWFFIQPRIKFLEGTEQFRSRHLFNDFLKV